MATYVNDLRLKEIGTGESSGTWGTETNVNLELIGEALGFGTEAITTNADTHTTTVADGSTDPGRAMYIKYTGTLDSACTITIGPNTMSRLHYIENATSGSQNIIISQGSGANITIPAGDTKAVYLDGAGSGAAVVDVFASFSAVDLKVQDDLTVTDDATIGGTLGVTGILTCTDDIIIGDGKTIGSASDVDAITIASNGQVTFTQTLIGTALDISGDIDVDGTSNLDVVDIDGAVDMASTLTVAGVVDITDSTDASDATGDTGALRTEGGASIAKKLYVGTDLDVDGTANLDVVDVDGLLTASAAIEINGAAGAAISEGLLIDWSTNLARFLTYDSSSGSEIAFFTQPNGGSSTERVRIKEDGGFVVTPAAGGHAVFNEGSIDADFRVESNGNANMLVVDGGSDFVSIGTAVDYDAVLNILSTDNTKTLSLVSTDTDANAGPILALTRQSSSSAADNDYVGEIKFEGLNDANEQIPYAGIAARIVDASDGTEDGRFEMYTELAGAQISRILANATETVLNEDSVDLNTRVETNANTHGLFVDAGGDRVVIGGDGSTNRGNPKFLVELGAFNYFEIKGATDSTANGILFSDGGSGTPYGLVGYDHANDGLNFFTAGNRVVDITSGGDVNIGLQAPGSNSHKVVIKEVSTIGTVNSHLCLVGDSATNDQGPQIMFSESGDGESFAGATVGYARQGGNGIGDLIFGTRASSGDVNTTTTERMRIGHNGDLLYGTTTVADLTKACFTFDQSSGRMVLSADGATTEPLIVNRHDSDGVLVEFRQANSVEGTISVSGSTVSYNGFSGSHDSSGIPSDTELGTVCSTIDELDTYPDTRKDLEGNDEDHPRKGQTRPDHAKIKVSDTVGDTRVYGVLGGFQKDGKPVVNSVGIGSIKVTGACNGGDLLESNGDGTAKVQSDDIIRSKTIGKVTIGNSTTTVKLVSCVLYCG